MPSPLRSVGFTLIELLVVITIIVILLALLVPAMDRAIYQAELTVCAAQMKTIGSAFTTYATDQKRSYPYREGVLNSEVGYLPQMLTLSAGGVYVNKTGRTFDDRVMLRPYMSMRLFHDPLVVTELDYDAIPAERGLNISNDIWVGWKYDGRRGMMKIGDKWRWTETNNDVAASLLYADQVDAIPGFGGVFASHPDSNGVMTPYVWDDANMSTAAGAGVPAGVANMQTGWNHGSAGEVGTFDRNFAYADGSVRRLLGISWERAKDKQRRIEHVPPAKNATSSAGNWKSVPVE